HRGAAFASIAEQAITDLRELLSIPANYKVLFLQGGAAGQFAGVPLNLLGGNTDKADYIVTGNWGKKAVKEAAKYGDAAVAASSEDAGFTQIPERASWALRDDAAYVHYAPNETVQGVEFPQVPDVGELALVGDMSSSFLSQPVDVSRFAVLYAGAQKNAGPAGVTIAIVRDDLLAQAQPRVPMLLDYAAQGEKDGILNTPPCYAWYISGLVFDWIKRNGGLAAMGERNARKAEKLYAAIDGSDFYRNPVAVNARSRMNVPFLLADDGLNATFLAEAEEAGLSTLKGHRSVGGMRASLYNAMPEAGVDELVAFMRDFEARNG